MLVHSVYFYLKAELSQAERTEFLAGLETLRAIPVAEAVHIGEPAPVAARPVLVQDYSYGLTVLFKDVAAHDAYQVHPLHKAFLEKFKSQWSKVVVFDTL